MEKDYPIYKTQIIDILGHKVKRITERWPNEYFNTKNFTSRCNRCCFYSKRESYSIPHICDFIDCRNYTRDLQTHYELIE